MNGMERSLRRIAAADAAWDAIVGIGLLAAPWTVSGWFGLERGGLWPLFTVLALGTFAFMAALIRAALGHDTQAIVRAAAIANAVAVPVIVAVLVAVEGLQAPAVAALIAAALICAVFAVLEYRATLAAPQEQ